MTRSPVLALTVTLSVALTANVARAEQPPAVRSFAEARSLLQGYCLKCHNAEKAEGGVNYAPLLASAEAALGKPKLWKRARRRLASNEMPPEGAKQPGNDDRRRLLAWMTAAQGFLDCDPARRDPGPSQLRRLTRTEYENTVRDLFFGLQFDAAGEAGLPAEAIGDGHFDTLAANLSLSPALIEKYFTAADRIVEAVFNDQRGVDRRRLFVARPDKNRTEAEAARLIAAQFARRAFRRPPRPNDVARLVGFFDRARRAGASFDDAVRAMLKPALVSPQFLLRVEEDRPAAGKPGSPVDDHELAVRLSYFLWSTMPDDELFKLAEAGKLSAPDVLPRQVARMLKDDRAKALTEGFAVQWLQLHKLAKARPTTEFFPNFHSGMKRAMRGEAIDFFNHLRTADRGVVELLDADYTFVNEELAKHYGIVGVTGDKSRMVTLKPEHHRGGILGMGAILALTSHTFRTSPTQRGKYVLEVIFGTPPPPPPANVSQLKDDRPRGKKQPLTFKEQLAQHAVQPSCAGCHKKIDPLGFALENYNAVGAWRESSKESPLDVEGVLPGGERVRGAGDLRRIILSRKDEFARNMAAKLLEYALGRELDGVDECTVRDVHEAMKKDGYRFSVMVTEIIKSVPFRQRRTSKR